MIHVIVAFDGTTLSVSIEPGLPPLTPLDVSNPEDSFASEDPWFETLDPSQRGLAFNRQYGFVLAGGSELAAEAGIWIRALSCSPGLEMYRYRATAPAMWEPMFGTRSSTNLLQWNLAMFHPAFAAPGGTGTHHATFEAAVVTQSTGELWPGANKAEFTLTLTNTPSARPAIEASQQFVITWAAGATNYMLQATDEATSGTWTMVTNVPVQVDGKRAVILPLTEAKRFFRLLRTQ